MAAHLTLPSISGSAECRVRLCCSYTLSKSTFGHLLRKNIRVMASVMAVHSSAQQGPNGGWCIEGAEQRRKHEYLRGREGRSPGGPRQCGESLARFWC